MLQLFCEGFLKFFYTRINQEKTSVLFYLFCYTSPVLLGCHRQQNLVRGGGKQAGWWFTSL